MAKKKKRKLQPHEKTFVNSVITGLCIALFFTVLAWPREVTYEEADVTVLRSNTTGRTGYNRAHLQIITTEGRVFNVSNAGIPLVELRKLLTTGTDIHVEYCHDWLIRLSPIGARPVKKLILDGQVLVDSPPGDNSAARIGIWLGLPFPLFGFLCWADGEHLLRKWKKKRDKERKRRKKEGKLK